MLSPEARIRELLDELDARHPGEKAHAERVAVYAVAAAHAMGLRGEELRVLSRAASLHDIGKLRLLPNELEAKKREHPKLATQVLADEPWAKPTFPWILFHHERWDGSGYPAGLVGGGGVLAIAEWFDVACHGAAWVPAQGRHEALEELRALAGRSFDPEATAAFLRIEGLIQPVGMP